jgi:hypothetical protein
MLHVLQGIRRFVEILPCPLASQTKPTDDSRIPLPFSPSPLLVVCYFCRISSACLSSCVTRRALSGDSLEHVVPNGCINDPNRSINGGKFSVLCDCFFHAKSCHSFSRIIHLSDTCHPSFSRPQTPTTTTNSPSFIHPSSPHLTSLTSLSSSLNSWIKVFPPLKLLIFDPVFIS